MGARQALLASAVLSLLAASAQAQFLSETQKRDQVRPLIIALTNCISKEALRDSAAPVAYRDGTFSAYIVRQIPECPTYVDALSQVYERVYGPGEATLFLNGNYANDLPRAVLHRIKPQLEAKVDGLKQAEAVRAAREAEETRAEVQRTAEAKDRAAKEESERATREAEERRIEDARRQRADIAQAEEDRRASAEREKQAALVEQQAAAAKAAATQAEAEAKAATAKAEAERLQRVDVAKKAVGLLVDKAAECSRHELRSLVRSGEGAEVLATAVMTICGSEVDHVLDAGVDEYKLEHQIGGSAFGETILRERLKAQAREQIVALAVQAKAGVGSFAPASSSN